MNERIKELEKQSVFYNEDEEIWEIDHKKFAELIVRECANWVENATVTDSAGNKDFIGDSYFWATEMKKHFGVEE